MAENKRQLREENETLKVKVAELEPKAQKADEIEAANKTELQKAIERAEAAELKAIEMEQREQAKAAEQKRRDIAAKVAADLGVPTEAALKLASKLDGEDDESLTASATELLGYLKPAAAPLPDAVDDNRPPAEADAFLDGMAEGFGKK